MYPDSWTHNESITTKATLQTDRTKTSDEFTSTKDYFLQHVYTIHLLPTTSKLETDRTVILDPVTVPNGFNASSINNPTTDSSSGNIYEFETIIPH